MSRVFAMIATVAMACLLTAPAAGQESQSLFNGKDLSGWTTNGDPKAWSVRDGAIVCGDGAGNWLRTVRPYRDFELTLEFRIEQGGNSGVSLRCAADGDPAFTGLEVQILDSNERAPTDTNCGAVYNAIAADTLAAKPAGSWNSYRIRLIDDVLDVWLNDVHIHKGERLDQRGYRHQRSNPLPLADRRHRGFIAFQDHGDEAAFRNINIIDLAPQPRVLVFSHTAGFRHGSIPTGIQTLMELGRENGYRIVCTEDSNEFNARNLRDYDAVVFLNTTGDVFNEEQEAALIGFVHGGGGYFGIHAASDTEFDWPWYGELVGAYFNGHPRIQKAEVVVENQFHPSTHHLARRWSRTDEWYNFRAVPREGVTILMRMNTDSYEGSSMPGNHPIAWCHEFEGGRSLYTAGGHTNEAFQEPDFRKHMAGALAWVTGRSEVQPQGSSTELK